MLCPGWGQGRGLINTIWGTRGRGVNRREGGVTGYTCERWLVGRLGEFWRAWVREWEVTVRRLVMLLVRQDGCRIVVVMMMEWRA